MVNCRQPLGQGRFPLLNQLSKVDALRFVLHGRLCSHLANRAVISLSHFPNCSNPVFLDALLRILCMHDKTWRPSCDCFKIPIKIGYMTAAIGTMNNVIITRMPVLAGIIVHMSTNGACIKSV